MGRRNIHLGKPICSWQPHSAGMAPRARGRSRFELFIKMLQGKYYQESFQNTWGELRQFLQGILFLSHSCRIWVAHHLQKWIKILYNSGVYQEDLRSSGHTLNICYPGEISQISVLKKGSERLGEGPMFLEMGLHWHGLNGRGSRYWGVVNRAVVIYYKLFFLYT